MSMTWEEFEAEYSDLADDVSRANYTTYEQKLRDFIAHIDSCDWARIRASQLAPDFNFAAWHDAARKSVGSMVGSGTLNWAADRKVRLGQQLALFRHFAETEDAYMNFASDFMYAGSRFDDMIREINDQLFEPFARDLRKDLFKHSPLETKSADVPASDRIVAVDHNSADYKTIETNLETLERAVQTSNALGAESPEERDRVVAEISATRRLLKATRARMEAVLALIVPALKWIGSKITDGAVQIAIAAAIAALAAMFGVAIPGL